MRPQRRRDAEHKENIRKRRTAELGRQSLYKAVFGTPQGQQVLNELYRMCDLTGICWDAENERRAAFKAGRRSVAVQIQEVISGRAIPLDPDAE